MQQKPTITITLIRDFLKKRFNEIFPALTLKEQRIISARFGLRNGVSHSLKDICEKFGVTVTQIRKIEANVLKKMKEFHTQRKEEKKKEPYTLKIYKGYSKKKREYWKTLKFPNFKESEKFIWKLFRKNYKITEAELIHAYQEGPSLIGLPTEWMWLWICNKKENKCYLFEPASVAEGFLFNFLFYQCEVLDQRKSRRRITLKDIKKLREKKERLLKKR